MALFVGSWHLLAAMLGSRPFLLHLALAGFRPCFGLGPFCHTLANGGLGSGGHGGRETCFGFFVWSVLGLLCVGVADLFLGGIGMGVMFCSWIPVSTGALRPSDDAFVLVSIQWLWHFMLVFCFFVA